MSDAGQGRGGGTHQAPARMAAAGPVRLGGRPPHIVCRRCGAVADADLAAGTVPCLQSATIAGFAIDAAQVTFWGVCPRCRALPPEG